jgi:putative flippase GtrA
MAIFRQGKNFLFFGIINFTITNIILQILLLFLNVWTSAILSQIINTLIGYRLYSRYVFRIKNYRSSFYLKYISFALIIYILNAKLIILLSSIFSISNNLSALILVPFLTSFSFIFQKFLIFKK